MQSEPVLLLSTDSEARPCRSGMDLSGPWDAAEPLLLWLGAGDGTQGLAAPSSATQPHAHRPSYFPAAGTRYLTHIAISASHPVPEPSALQQVPGRTHHGPQSSPGFTNTAGPIVIMWSSTQVGSWGEGLLKAPPATLPAPPPQREGLSRQCKHIRIRSLLRASCTCSKHDSPLFDVLLGS